MDLRKLATDLKNFEGVKRKAAIGPVSNVFFDEKPGENHYFGDDAAVIEIGDKTLLFACDSINETLVNADPYFAGYSAVLVNVSDIAAMGGCPLALVDVLSARDTPTALEISRGVNDAGNKFGVPIVGGHLNPNSTYNGIEISIIGEVKADYIIKASTAKPGEVILAAIDLDGKLHPRYDYAWDTTSKKSSEKVKNQLKIMVRLGEKGIVSSCRDISNPGVIGTLGMLLECSQVGGIVDLEKIPTPKGVDLTKWLKVYPGYGFVMTVKEPVVEEVVSTFLENNIEANSIGVVTKTQKLLISWRGNGELVFDFKKESITGV
jgi:putative methanogenesis marker protein 2